MVHHRQVCANKTQGNLASDTHLILSDPFSVQHCHDEVEASWRGRWAAELEGDLGPSVLLAVFIPKVRRVQTAPHPCQVALVLSPSLHEIWLSRSL